MTLRYQGQTVRVSGDLRWVPGPSAAPRLALALLVALLVAAVGFARWWGATVAVILLALAALVTVLVAGEWGATSAGPWIALLSTVYSLLGIVHRARGVGRAGACTAHADRRERDRARCRGRPLLREWSRRRDVPRPLATPHDPAGPLARTFVALVLGGSIGVLVTAARHLRRPALLTVGEAPPMRSPQPAPTDERL